MLKSDSEIYGGSNLGNLGGVTADEYTVHGQPFSAEFTLPPLSVIAFKAGAWLRSSFSRCCRCFS